ncbi:MAG: hypothetical protein M9894_09725 [Planctomycetes bacterium]|nr:hypothetical protein [Planctomycetota bacterium]
MRSGPLAPELKERTVDRSETTFALWESVAGGGACDLPWRKATDVVAAVTSLIGSAKSLVVATGKTTTSGALLDAVLASPPGAVRTYVYAGRHVESDRRVFQALGSASDRLLMRLGYDLPADWLVADAGRAGVLLVGPPGADRRWAVPVDGQLARSLFEAFHALFWHHATREALPDAAGVVAFRSPLPAPTASRGNDVTLPAGRLLIDGKLAELIAEADVRVLPDGSVGGRAGIAFVPPKGDVTVPKQLAAEATQVVWADAGLPRTAVSRERMVLDLVERPVALQLEWPRRDAIDMYHRLTKLAASPSWRFHARRRLADVTGEVLVEGATAPGKVVPVLTLDATEVTAPPDRFDEAQPERLPDPPPLALRVTYRWKLLPLALPTGAREAELTRQWRAVNEWATRRVETLRQALDGLEGEEKSILDRLRRWLSGHDELRRRHAMARETLQVLAEVPPGQQPATAGELLQQLEAATQDVKALAGEWHSVRSKAETSSAEASQRAEWQERTSRAASDAAAKRTELAGAEGQVQEAGSALESAEALLKPALDVLRAKRKAALEADRDLAAKELAEARREAEEQINANSKKRKELKRRVTTLEERHGQIGRDLDLVNAWEPPSSDLGEALAPVTAAKAALDAARERARTLSSAVATLEAATNEPFVFAPLSRPARAPELPVVDVAAPPVPGEAPPELGELFEHKNKRYLALKTWEQVARARPVAARLKADLVAMSVVGRENRATGV